MNLRGFVEIDLGPSKSFDVPLEEVLGRFRGEAITQLTVYSMYETVKKWLEINEPEAVDDAYIGSIVSTVLENNGLTYKQSKRMLDNLKPKEEPMIEEPKELVVDHNTVVVESPKYSANKVVPFPEHETAIANITYGWRTEKASLFNVGQRSGKGSMVIEFIRRMGMDYTPIYVTNDFSAEQVKRIFGEHVRYMTYRDLHMYLVRMPKLSTEIEADQTMIDFIKNAAFFFDEAFFESQANSIVTALLEYTHRIVITSSEGDFTFDLPEDKGFNYYAATWDWNPLVKPEHLEDHFEADFQKAARDFGLKHSHNKLAILTLTERFSK